MPEKGTRWRNPGLRGYWTVTVIGRKYITLSSTIPSVGLHHVPLEVWPGRWERA